MIFIPRTLDPTPRHCSSTNNDILAESDIVELDKRITIDVHT